MKMHQAAYLIVTLLIVITGCGGGGSNTTTTPTPTPTPIPTPAENHYIQTYTVAANSEGQSYGGECIDYACYPVIISGSAFTISAKIEYNKISIYSFFNRDYINQFELSAVTLSQKRTAEGGSLDGDWVNKSYAGMFGEPIISAVYDGGELIATDTSGCYMVGTITPNETIYSVSLAVSDCDDSGVYIGLIHVSSGQINGAVFSDDKSIIFDFYIYN